jgi:iron complex transport system permease protein
VAGPIGFVGLIVPHAVRALAGPDHRLLLGLSFFGGGAFLAAADTVARSAFAPSELPVGVLTAMLGGPFFLLLLLGRAEEL